MATIVRVPRIQHEHKELRSMGYTDELAVQRVTNTLIEELRATLGQFVGQSQTTASNDVMRERVHAALLDTIKRRFGDTLSPEYLAANIHMVDDPELVRQGYMSVEFSDDLMARIRG